MLDSYAAQHNMVTLSKSMHIVTITNSQIYNSSNFGVLGRATSIKGENVVINNSGQSSFAGTIGGKYNFTHCTITNYWNNSFNCRDYTYQY